MDVTAGQRGTFIVPPRDAAALASSVLLDGRRWCPADAVARVGFAAPIALSALWPDLLRLLAQSADAPLAQAQLWLDVLGVQLPNGEMRRAGPSVFLQFLAWAETSYADVLQLLPCHGRHYVSSGAPADASLPLTRGDPAGCVEWVAECGKVARFGKCAAAVSQPGAAWERLALSDVVCRHPVAAISSKFSGGPSVDDTFAAVPAEADLR